MLIWADNPVMAKNLVEMFYADLQIIRRNGAVVPFEPTKPAHSKPQWLAPKHEPTQLDWLGPFIRPHSKLSLIGWGFGSHKPDMRNAP
jgi:hypothetical protein